MWPIKGNLGSVWGAPPFALIRVIPPLKNDVVAKHSIKRCQNFNSAKKLKNSTDISNCFQCKHKSRDDDEEEEEEAAVKKKKRKQKQKVRINLFT